MVVLVTGASSGIGRALALHYLDRGAAVAAVARRAAPLHTLHRPDAQLATFTADVADRARMATIISEVERTLGPIRLAIACAGVAEHEIGPDVMLEGLDLMLATNTVGAFNTLVPAAAIMRARGDGHIVAISSLAALHGIPIMAGYCMSKAALESGMQSLRYALHGTGVRVSVIAPGFIATEMTAARVDPMFCMPLERAVRRIVAAIERRQPVYRFPLWQHAVVRMLPLLTARAQSSLLGRLTQLRLPAAPSRKARNCTRKGRIMGESSRRRHGFWTNLRYQLTFNSFIRPGNFVRLAHCLPEISPRYWPRAALISIIGLLALPLRWAETLFFGRRIANTRIDHPPIFIIGHWRSGTTHLHNLFSQDPALGWVSMYQAIAPDCSLIGGRWLRQALAWLVPLQRPMDNMIWSIDSPQEEEVALGKICAWSFYTQVTFPRRAREFFERYVLLEGATTDVVSELRARYLRILQIATLHSGGRRLVLKNPVNTARIRLLLTLFPDAKFIHIHRSPYEVFASTRNLHHRLVVFTTLQKLDVRNSAEMVFALYEGMMRRFLADRPLIPPGNFAEIQFSDLERDPIGEMHRLYDELGLPGFEAAEPALRRHISGLTDYRKNSFRPALEECERITERWSFAFDAFGYRKTPSYPTAEAPLAAD